MIGTEVKPPRTVSPFVWVALAWGVAGSLISAWAASSVPAFPLWFFGLWSLSLFDLYSLLKALRAVAFLMNTESGASNRAAHTVDAIFWGSTKMVCLGALAGVLFWAKQAPQADLMLGIGTLIAVPLVGGFWWSQRELRSDKGALNHAW